MLGEDCKFLLEILREEIKTMRGETIINRSNIDVLKEDLLNLSNTVSSFKDDLRALEHDRAQDTKGRWTTIGLVINGIFALLAAIIAFKK